MQNKVHCEICGVEIPRERLKILPDTQYCVKCSQTQPYSEADALHPNLFEEQERNAIYMDSYEIDYADDA